MNSNLSYGPETAKLGFDLCDLDLWPLTLTFCMDITFVIGDNSWKFHDDTMVGTWWKRCDGQTDGLNHSWSCLVAAKNAEGCDEVFWLKFCYSYLVPERQTKLCMVWPYRYDFGMVLRLIHRGCLIILCDNDTLSPGMDSRLDELRVQGHKVFTILQQRYH